MDKERPRAAIANAWPPGGKYAKKLRELINSFPLDDHSEEQAQHKAAIKRWRRRQRTAKARLGYKKAEEHQDETCTRSAQANDALIKAKPRCLQGLIAKARAVVECDNDDMFATRASVVRDLLELAEQGAIA